MRTEQEIREALELLVWATNIQQEAGAPTISIVYPLGGADVLSWVLGSDKVAISSYLETVTKIRGDLLRNPPSLAHKRRSL